MRDLLQIIRTELRGSWRYRWMAMLAAWIICVAGWLSVFAQPDIYEARAQVYVDANSRLAGVMGEVGVAPGVNSRVYVVRQAMLGRPQLERVARDTDLDLRAHSSEQMETLLFNLRENIRVVSGRTAQARNLYTITYNDRDRDMSIAVVQTLLNTFVEDVLDLKEQGTEDVTDYLENQLNHYSDLLSESELQLANFKKEYVGLLPGESGGIFERLQSEMDAVRLLRSELQIEEDRRNELRRQLQADSPYLSETAGGSTGAPVPGSSTEAALNELEARRATLLLTYTERHPDIVAINEQLEQLYAKTESDRAALADAVSGIEGVANSTNPVYQSVQIALNEAGVRIAGVRSQIAQRDAMIRQFNDQVNTIPEVEAKYAELTRDYAQYKSLYDELLLRKERERMGTVGDDQDVVTFNIIDPPSASLEPVAPKRGLLLIVVLVMGFGAGAAVAFLIHKFHPVFHDARTLGEVTGRPVLGVVSMTWLERRPESSPPVHGIAAFKRTMQATRSWQLRVPQETTNLIVDSPASLTHDDLREVTRDANSILVPVMPSSIDIHAASRCIADLLLVAKIDRRDRKLAVVANRTRKNTRSFEKLMRFLDSLGIPIIAVLRDSQNFVHAAEDGIGVCEMTPYKVKKDMEQLEKIIEWLDRWKDRRYQTSDSSIIEQSPNVTMLRKPGMGGHQ
jgi:polysaccharide chain length determinant protein (PEP-CTERM system associated)